MEAGEIARRRIRNTGLVRSSFATVEEIVRWHGAIQAQDYVPTKWSLAQRVPGLTDEAIDEALAAGAMVRTHVLRPTWHLVARDDIRWLLALTGPIVQRGSQRRLRELRLDPKVLARSERVISSALKGGSMTREEVGAVLKGARIDPDGQRLPYLLMHCELEAVICSAGLRGAQHTYGLLDERVPSERKRFDRDAALIELTRRYLTSHGPAAVQDLGWWASLRATDIRHALDALDDEVRSETVDSVELWMDAGEPSRAPAVRGVHLLPPYDELVVGYRNSRYFGDPRAKQTLAAWKDRTLPNGVVIFDGRVIGLWRRITEARSIRLEFHSFERLDRKRIERLRAAGRRLGRFVGRPVTTEVDTLHPRALT
jgi:DNA glycosylase AlkZ-like